MNRGNGAGRNLPRQTTTIARGLLFLIAYLGTLAAWTYAVFDRGGTGRGIAAASLFAVALTHVVVGFRAGRWSTALLPFLAIPVAIPAGYPNGVGGEPFPVWADFVLLAPCGSILVLVGLATRRFVHR